jgi:hypothetical protein
MPTGQIMLNVSNKTKIKAITGNYKTTTIFSIAAKEEQPETFGFFQPKHWFYKNILVQCNQLIPCGY